MRRFALLVLLAVTLGVATSVAVAWGAAALRPADGWPNVLGKMADGWKSWYLMPQHRARTPGGDVFVDVTGTSVSCQVGLAPAWTHPDPGAWSETYPDLESVRPEYLALMPTNFRLPAWAALPDGSTTARSITTAAWGWPALCLAGTEYGFSSYSASRKFVGTRWELTHYWAIGAPHSTARLRRLPLAVYAPGLATDTLVYGAVWSALLMAPRTARRAFRRRRGRCPRCGYDLKHDLAGGCPECGWGRSPAEPR